MTDVLIIGAGIAGLSAGVYAAREGLDTLVLEQKICGGQIVNSPKVKNYPGIKETSGYELATALYEQAMEAGAKVEFQKVEQVIKVDGDKPSFRVVAGGTIYESKTVIVATGAKNRPLGLENEQALIGKGVSYCATCDGAFFRGKTVAVNGGGNTAVMDAIFLSSYCEKVYLIHRRDEFRAESKLMAQAEGLQNVEIIRSATISDIKGTENVEGLILITKDGSEMDIEVAGLFVAIGNMPDTKAFESILALDKNGYVMAKDDCKTSVEGIYAAGDCRTKEIRQLVTAAADGAISALAATKYIKM